MVIESKSIQPTEAQTKLTSRLFKIFIRANKRFLVFLKNLRTSLVSIPRISPVKMRFRYLGW